MKIVKALFYLCFLSMPFLVKGQNYVIDFQARPVDKGMKIAITTSGDFNFELIPFDSRAYTLLKINPAQFKPETRDSFISPLKKLPVKIQALELMDHSLLLAFKGVLQNQLTVTRQKTQNKLEILVAESAVTPEKSRFPQKTAIDYYNSAVQLEKNNKHSAAIKAIRTALKMKPDYAQAYFLAGKIRYKLGHWQMAKTNFKLAKRINPQVGDDRYYLAEIEKKLNPVSLTKTDDDMARNENTGNTDIRADTRSEIVEKPGSDSIAAEDSSSQISAAVPPLNLDDLVRDLPEEKLAEYPIKTKSQFYFQMVFFCFIILVILAWGILLYKKRDYLRRNKKQSSFDFEAMIKKLQSSHPGVGRDMPELERKPEIESKDRAESSVEGKRDRHFTRTENKFEQRHFMKDRQSLFQSPPLKMATGDDINEKVLDLAAIGYSVDEIARYLGIGKGEIQLILNFSGREVPMSAPSVRIKMDEQID